MVSEKRAATPETFHRSYADAFNSGDTDSLVRLYEQGTVLVPRPGEVVSGRGAIREALGQYLAVGKMTAETLYCITSGDVALASASWQVAAPAPTDGRSRCRGRAPTCCASRPTAAGCSSSTTRSAGRSAPPVATPRPC